MFLKAVHAFLARSELSTADINVEYVKEYNQCYYVEPIYYIKCVINSSNVFRYILYLYPQQANIKANEVCTLIKNAFVK
jgi:hypothetical protein